MTARTGLVLDKLFARHDTAPGHPERPERCLALVEYLEREGLADKCRTVAPERAVLADVACVHTPQYLERLKRACAEGEPYIDTPDSSICKESFEIALYAAGSAMRCVDLVMAGEIENAFALVRPPGHHAEAGCSMGFCLLNNIALCAQRLLARWGLTRVLIVDFDVHHGNGTQHLFEADPRVLFFSMHGHPNSFYPGTGYEHERGLEAGSGTTINCPMLPGFGDDEYRRAFYEVLIPAAESFQPEFVLVSAGFDAHQDDWISRIALDDSSYEWLSRGIVSLAQRWARGRVVSLLEGGYNLDALCRCAAIHLRELLAAQSAA